MPARVFVEERLDETIACPNDDTIVSASPPPQIVERGKLADSLIVEAVSDKFIEHLPIETQCARFARSGVDVAPQTLGRSVSVAIDLLAPIAHLIREQTRGPGLLGTDATGIPVLDPAAADGIRHGTIWAWTNARWVSFFYSPSQRNGEVRALRVMDVDFKEVVVSIRKAFSADAVVSPKSGDERALPLAEPLRVILEQLATGKKPTDRLVTDDAGRTPSRQRIYQAFVALQRKLGFSPTWSFHSLRHAFGTHATRSGASVEAVREMMGHSDLSSTARYLHATSQDKVRAIALLAGNWGETP